MNAAPALLAVPEYDYVLVRIPQRSTHAHTTHPLGTCQNWKTVLLAEKIRQETTPRRQGTRLEKNIYTINIPPRNFFRFHQELGKDY